MKVNFYVRKDKDSERGQIYLHVRRQRNQHLLNIKYYLGITIDASWWLPGMQRLKVRDDIPYKEFNAKIDKAEFEINRLFLEKDFYSITDKVIREELDHALYDRKKIDPTDFIAYSEISILKRFKSKITFSDINYQFLKDFASWMAISSSDRTGQIYKASTIRSVVNKIKARYREAVRAGLAEDRMLDYSFAAPRVVTVYLNENDLDKLRTVKLSRSRDLIRDWFLVGCYTGLRAGNYLALSRSNINLEKNYIETVVNKNGPLIKIPIHRVVREIIEKYQGNIPPGPSIYYFDRTIKLICRQAKITDTVILPINRGNIRSEQAFEKWELVSSHTARRTMATMLYLKNVPIRYIMAILGHTSEATTLHYIKAGLNEVYEDVSKLDFWK